MGKRWLLGLVVGIGLGMGARLAGAEPTQEVFVRHLMERVAAGDGKGILVQAAANPGQAREAFEYFLKGYDQYTQARPLRARILNMLARALALKGESELTEVLQERQLLDPTLAKWTLEVAPGVALEEKLAASDLAHWTERSRNYLAEAGAYRQLAELLAAQPESEENQRDAWACRILAGQYQAAREREPSDPMGCALMLHGGWQGGMPDLVEGWLKRLEQSLAQATERERPWYYFLLTTWQSRRELERRPEMPQQELLERHEAAWKLLDGAQLPAAGSLIPGLFGPAARFWATALERRYSAAYLDENEPLVAAMERGNAALFRLVQSEFKEYREAIALVSNLCLLDRHEASLELEWAWDPKTFAKLADLLDVLVQNGKKINAEREQDLQATLPASLAARLPSGFRVHLTESNWALLGERLQRARLHQRMCEEDAPSTAELMPIARQGLEYQAVAQRGLGYQGMQDLRWTYLKLLIAWTPENWEREFDEMVAQLLQLNTELNYRPGMAMALAYQASRHSQQGDRSGAIERFQAAVEAYESYAQEVGLEGLPGLRRDFTIIYDRLSELLIESGQTTKAWTMLQRQLQLQGLFEHQEGLATRPQLAQVRDLQRRCAALQQQTLLPQGPGGELLRLTRGQFREVLSALYRSNRRLAEALAIEPVSLPALQAKLPRDVVLVQYFPTGRRLFIFLVTRQGLQVRTLTLSSTQLKASVKRARHLLIRGGTAGDFQPGASLRQELRQLDEWLLEPVRADLSAARVVALRPTQILHYVPFAALLGKDGKYQVERQATVNLVKSADLSLLTRAPRPRPKSLLAFGNPDGTLPGAAREVKEIVALFAKTNPAIGAAATAERLRSMDPSTGYLHLATHGILAPTDPRQSYLVLARSRLRTADIYALNLSGVGLVTLSACNTAVQETNPGAEVHSLAEAFSVAGGQSVLASLWSVSDDGTRALMVRFYQEVLRGRSLAESLRKAQLSLRQNPRYAHPFFWASFTLLGDWR
jgi:CHAT domain-containing protein